MPFQIIRDDITKVKADAIVNSANPKPAYGRGTDSAIYRMAGKEQLLAMRREIGEIEPGQVRETPAPGLPAEYILHTVGPVWQGGGSGEFETLQACYENCLALAQELGCESIAFPLISSGYYRFPKDKALQIAISVFSRFLLSSDMNIILVVFDRRSFELSGKIFSDIDEFIDEHYAEAAIEQEYGGTTAADTGKRKGIPALMREKLAGGRRYHSPQKENIVRPVGSAGKDSRQEELSAWDLKDTFEESAASWEPDEEIYECFSNTPAMSSYREEDSVSVPPPAGKDAAFARPSKPPKTLEEALAHAGDTWQQSLLRLIDEKQMTDVEVYKSANVDRRLFSKIRSDVHYQPKKKTAVAFALALHLNLDDTKDFIGRAGFAFSPSSFFDLIVQYFIDQEVYDTCTINLALFAHDQPLIGG